MHRQEACNYKKLYDTEFESQRAAAKMERRVEEEFIHYPCGNHWHIAHKDREQRNRHIKDMRTRCEVCNCDIKVGTYGKHAKKMGHQTRERKLNHVEP